MGCGSSNDPKIGVADSIKPVDYKNNYNNNKSSQNSTNNNRSNRNGFKQVELKSSDEILKNNHKLDEKKAPLAFVIQFDETKKNGTMHRPPPGRLQLEPLKLNSQLTQEKLDEKMRAVERNREQILAKRVKSSKSSKKRNNLQRKDDESDYSKENSMDRTPNNNYERKPKEMRNNERRSSEEDAKRERLLKARRIVPNKAAYDYDDDEIEHDKNYNKYNKNDDDYNVKKNYSIRSYN